MLILSWFWPFIVVGIGYLWSVLPWTRDETGWGVVLQCALVAIWIIYEVVYTVFRNTPTSSLMIDLAGDIVSYSIMLADLVSRLRGGSFHWWIVVPFIGATIDVFQSGLFGINNAAEKPYVPTKPT